MTRITEIETRLSAIKAEIETEGADITALTTEVDTLMEERKGLMDAIETRKATLDKIANGTIGTVVVDNFKGEDKMEERKFGVESAEYRSAFLNTLRQSKLNDIEQRAYTTVAGSAGAAVPTQTVNKILEKVHEYAPLLDKIDLLKIIGRVTIPAEGTTVDAQLHAEGAAISADGDTIYKIDLGSYEITKLVTISKSVETMSIDAFEAYIANKIGRKIADKITDYILHGTGTSQPQGINAISWDDTNSVSVAASGSLTEANVDTLVSLLNGGYDAGAEWVMSKKTFFSDFRPIQNKSKNDVVLKEGNTWYIEGYPVNFDERVTLHEAYLGNFEMGYAGNMAEDVTLTSQFFLRENSFDFLGTAMFDGKVSAVEAFVKLTKAAA